MAPKKKPPKAEAWHGTAAPWLWAGSLVLNTVHNILLPLANSHMEMDEYDELHQSKLNCFVIRLLSLGIQELFLKSGGDH